MTQLTHEHGVGPGLFSASASRGAKAKMANDTHSLSREGKLAHDGHLRTTRLALAVIGYEGRPGYPLVGAEGEGECAARDAFASTRQSAVAELPVVLFAPGFGLP